MAELTAQERLQPSLLDRLTDRAPDTKVESRERRVLSVQRLREAVLRDLSWLLNTGHLETTDDLDGYPHVRDSVLNYGMPDIAGVTASSADTERLEKAVRQCVIRFEPRIAPDTVRVGISHDETSMGRNSMVFTIEGQLWAEPAPIPLYLKTEVDLETGNVAVTEA